MSNAKTEQELFWAGEFGTNYISRNRGEDLIAGNTAFFAEILAKTTGVKTLLELGANIGLNLAAIRRLLPGVQMSAVEINPTAGEELRKLGVDVTVGSLLDYVPTRTFDFVLIKTVLIHLAPERLADAYRALHDSCGRYLCVAEYYNPSPVHVSYRGHEGKLYKRDFAGEMMDKYPDLHLIDYGFRYHRDLFPQDDVTWFLMERR
jgi:pseudaminic acid biosynthesis-associated methylase